MIILLSPQSKFQPIYIEDVSNILIKSMFDKKTFGKVYDMGGSDIYTLKDIVRLIIKSEKLNRIIIPLNKSLSYLFAFSMELMPIKILTRDNWRSMQVDNVVNNEHSIHYRYTFMRLGRYLDQNKQNTPLMRSRYDSFRSKSGR
jgi:NADH dehydrogenase